MCVITKSSGSSTCTRLTKGKAITMCGDRERVSYGQRALNGQISTSVIAVCGQKAPTPSTVFKYVRSFKCGKETAQLVLLQNPLIMVQCGQTQAPKETAAMYIFRNWIFWGSSCSLISNKIITSLQMRRVQKISRLPYRRILHFSAFLISNIFSRLLQTPTLNVCFSSKMNKNTQNFR